MIFPFYLALKNFQGRNKRLSTHLLSAVFGVALSLIPLIVVVEVSDGMIEGITSRYMEVGTYHLQVTLAADSLQKQYEDVASRISVCDSIRNVVIERQGMGLISANKVRTGVTIRAVPASLYSEDEAFRKYFSIDQGFFDLENANSILLGKEVAARLGVTIGDQVKLLTILASRSANRRTIPKVTSFKVEGIFSTGYQELDKLWIYIPLETGLRILSRRDSDQFIGIKVTDPFSADFADSLTGIIPSDARIHTWYQLEKANYKSYQTTKTLLIFIMALIVLVASVNISSSLIMIVLERMQDIGILKGMGAHPRDIRMTFLFIGFIIGLAGTFIGLLLGILIAININELFKGLEFLINAGYNALELVISPFTVLKQQEPITLFNTAYYLEEIPIRVKMKDLLIISVFSLVLSTLAAYFPARNAGRIKPLEIFHKY